ncbi:MAG: hypothetical protein CVU55_03790 [Deltaproteobacteria bacterium HGW-Deltaproteobacteria-13]|nr:MAG: hypothetical protein CVU55_03790 [Deltaproteobacteria bacterium HGW-Deltaproteobacteria-13]
MVPASHVACFRQALVVLRNDGRNNTADMLVPYADNIDTYLQAADWRTNPLNIWDASNNPVGIPYSAANHWLNPVGFVTSAVTSITDIKNAAGFCAFCFNIAIALWQLHDYNHSTAALGVALHLVQDLTVPHHAVPTPGNNHLDYENWLNNNLHAGTIANGGNYNNYLIAPLWVWNIATRALLQFPYCDGINPPFRWLPLPRRDNYDRVRNEMAPRAIRSSAGFLECFRYRTTLPIP